MFFECSISVKFLKKLPQKPEVLLDYVVILPRDGNSRIFLFTVNS